MTTVSLENEIDQQRQTPEKEQDAPTKKLHPEMLELVRISQNLKHNLDNFKILKLTLQELHNLHFTSLKTQSLKNQLITEVSELYQIQRKIEIYKGILTYMILASFKTAETIIIKLSDTPARKLNRRFKYAWQGLIIRKDGTVQHNFSHSVGNVPQTYIEQVTHQAPKFHKNLDTSPYFLARQELQESEEFDREHISTGDMFRPKINCINLMHNPTDTLRNDEYYSDVYYQPVDDIINSSPCGLHEENVGGYTKHRADCIICKEFVEIEHLPIVISKSLLSKLNVTENLLKFLAIQKSKHERERLEEDRNRNRMPSFAMFTNS